MPIWKQTAADLRSWLAVRGEVPTPELFINARGEPMTRKGFTYLLDKYAQLAMENCLSLKGKNISPHVLRHYLPFLTMSCRASPILYSLQTHLILSI
jgi:site-specific recombinase XerD